MPWERLKKTQKAEKKKETATFKDKEEEARARNVGMVREGENDLEESGIIKT